jgi:hypothetical protein
MPFWRARRIASCASSQHHMHDIERHAGRMSAIMMARLVASPSTSGGRE